MRDYLALTSVKFKTSIKELWAAPRIIAFLEQFSDAISHIREGYEEILTWLEEQHEDGDGSWVSSETWFQKKLIVKKLVIFKHFAEGFRDCFNIFERLEPYFRRELQVCSSGKPQKRQSFTSQSLRGCAMSANSHEQERMLTNFSQLLEQKIHSCLSNMHVDCDNCVIFEAYTADLQRMNREEKNLWGRCR